MFKRDALNIVIGIPWLIAMYLCPVYLVLHRFPEAAAAFLLVAILSFVLYNTWFKHIEDS
jgi:hypothetical protein